MPKTWEYRGYVIEEDFESDAWRAPRTILKTRTGYVVRSLLFTKENMLYAPGKWRTLAEARQWVDELIKEGGW